MEGCLVSEQIPLITDEKGNTAPGDRLHIFSWCWRRTGGSGSTTMRWHNEKTRRLWEESPKPLSLTLVVQFFCFFSINGRQLIQFFVTHLETSFSRFIHPGNTPTINSSSLPSLNRYPARCLRKEIFFYAAVHFNFPAPLHKYVFRWEPMGTNTCLFALLRTRWPHLISLCAIDLRFQQLIRGLNGKLFSREKDETR